MTDFKTNALAYLIKHWHTGIAGTGNASDLLNINPSTFKTRLARGHALVLRDSDGKQRASLVFTGYQLVHNFLSDRLLRYGLSAERDQESTVYLPHVYADWAYDNILHHPHRFNAFLRFWKGADGITNHMLYEKGTVEADRFQDASLIIPLGAWVLHLAARLYANSGQDEMINDMLRHVGPLSDGLESD